MVNTRQMAFAPRGWLRLAVSMVLALVWVVPAALGQVFTPAVSYSTGSSSNPQAVAIADVNADGKRDIITANYISNSVGVLLGTGNGTFQTAVSYYVPINSSPNAVAVADVNGDDKLDIITANYNSASAGVLLGNGNGTFQPTVSYLMGTGFPTGVAVADVSGDGKPDIVLVSYTYSAVGVLLGNGNGTFQPGVLYYMAYLSGSISVVLADFNADTNLDIAVANYGANSVGVFAGNGNGTFQPAVAYATGAGSRPQGIVQADFNADGRPDIAVTYASGGGVGVLLGASSGTLQPAVTYATHGLPYSIAVADVDGDAKADLFAANLNLGSVDIFRGTGTGTFQPAVAIAVGSGRAVNDLAVADVNGDAKPDIVTAYSNNNSVAVQLNTTYLATAAAASQGQLTLAPNPANTRAAMLATGLPATVHSLEATLYSPMGQVVCHLVVPVVHGHAQAAVPTLGLASGVYVMHVGLRNAQGIAVGVLPTQRLAIE